MDAPHGHKQNAWKKNYIVTKQEYCVLWGGGILEATLHKADVVRPPVSYRENHLNKTSMT